MEMEFKDICLDNEMNNLFFNFARKSHLRWSNKTKTFSSSTTVVKADDTEKLIDYKAWKVIVNCDILSDENIRSRRPIATMRSTKTKYPIFKTSHFVQ